MNDSKPDHSQPENQPGEERLTTPDEVSGASSDAGLASQTVDAAMYGLSLPERVARAMIGTTSRVARDTAEEHEEDTVHYPDHVVRFGG